MSTQLVVACAMPLPVVACAMSLPAGRRSHRGGVILVQEGLHAVAVGRAVVA
jgi:hypothetical protein